jgi:hypothetical protein
LREGAEVNEKALVTGTLPKTVSFYCWLSPPNENLKVSGTDFETFFS